MLLEVGEFVKRKHSNRIVWIERIDRYRDIIEIGKMNYEDNEFVKTFVAMGIEEFYNKYEDLKGDTKCYGK